MFLLQSFLSLPFHQLNLFLQVLQVSQGCQGILVFQKILVLQVDLVGPAYLAVLGAQGYF